MKIIPLKGGAEHDGLRKSTKKYHGWVAGERKKIKRRYNKRIRRLKKQKIKWQLQAE